MIALEVEIKPETHEQLNKLIEKHPTWNQHAVIQYALELFLQQQAGAA